MRSVVLFALLLCAGCSSTSENTASSAGSEALSANQINGGTTGAMVRDTTSAGYVCITSLWTVPDYDPTQPGEPWIYYGFGDENGTDMEVGLAFQKGDGTAAKPHRWLPYMRKGKTFYFGDESERALPGDTTELDAYFDGTNVTFYKDQNLLTLSGGGTTIQALDMSALDPNATHVRRVVGNAVSWSYGGGQLGTVGPVTFQNTSVCDPSGSTTAFHGVAGWSETRSGVLYGTAHFPQGSVSASYDPGSDTDTITLFPASQ